MKDKVKVGIILTLALILTLAVQYFSQIVFDFFILFFTLIAVIEFRKMALKSGYPTFDYVPEITTILVFLGMLISVLCKLKATTIMLIALIIVLVVYLAVYLGAILIFKKDLTNDKFRQVANMSIYRFAFFKINNTLANIVYPSLFMFFIYMINHIQSIGLVSLNEATKGAPLGLFGLILLFAICCLSDTFAMLFGSWIKGKKLCPTISPKKTISGALFGLLGGLLGSLITYWSFNAIFPEVFANVYFWQFMIIGVIGSAVSQGGDIFESFLKRKADIKDAGEFFRSHGGVLDRFDSIIFNAPLVFSCLLILFS